jgi:hypothetical protein
MKELAIDWQPHPKREWCWAGQQQKLCLVEEGFLCLCFDGNAKGWNQSFNPLPTFEPPMNKHGFYFCPVKDFFYVCLQSSVKI